VETPLQYALVSKDAFPFLPAGSSCTGCDVTFATLYPVVHYELALLFPESWTWDRIVVIKVEKGGEPFPDASEEINKEGSHTFKWVSPVPLHGGTRLIFKVLPNADLPGRHDSAREMRP
jgi:hypothetical protein